MPTIDLAVPCHYPPQKPNRYGYVAVRVGPRSEGRKEYGHRIAWERVNGPIPPGHEIDHLCHDPAICHAGNACPHRACDEPLHLVAVPHGDNVNRGGNRGVQVMAEQRRARTVCPSGHSYDGRNAKGARTCSICGRARTRRYRARLREASREDG